MLRLDGSKINQKRKDGRPLMVARMVYAEPEFWDLLKSVGSITGKSRSTQIRVCAKRWMAQEAKSRRNIIGINWDE
jgi:hypothetical protein